MTVILKVIFDYFVCANLASILVIFNSLWFPWQFELGGLFESKEVSFGAGDETTSTRAPSSFPPASSSTHLLNFCAIACTPWLVARV